LRAPSSRRAPRNPFAPGAAEQAGPGVPGVFFSTAGGWPETVDTPRLRRAATRTPRPGSSGRSGISSGLRPEAHPGRQRSDPAGRRRRNPCPGGPLPGSWATIASLHDAKVAQRQPGPGRGGSSASPGDANLTQRPKRAPGGWLCVAAIGNPRTHRCLWVGKRARGRNAGIPAALLGP
jgi:hypothetical protein